MLILMLFQGVWGSFCGVVINIPSARNTLNDEIYYNDMISCDCTRTNNESVQGHLLLLLKFPAFQSASDKGMLILAGMYLSSLEDTNTIPSFPGWH